MKEITYFSWKSCSSIGKISNCMAKPTWSGTRIYQTLADRKSPHADAMCNLLNRPPVMPAIELILDQGATTPKDFTLHDSGHSFRVAERMWKLIPEGTKEFLSDYELGMLLLCAYLHDMGMSPEYEKVQRLRRYLTEKKEGLSEQEINDLQQWIDGDPHSGSLDVRAQIVTDTPLINYLLSYYIRHKHNDWSGDWIKKNLAGEKLPHYPYWVDDLILICKSHHYGLDHLLQESFDPRPVTPEMIVHLRYLAMCLRVADVMENDPERTPEVILNHRQIEPGSLKFWLKDHPFRLLESGNTYTVHARPQKAFIHKAVEETASQIEAELKLCDELIRRKPLSHSPAMPVRGYEWVIDPVVKRDIRPEKDSYEFINGAFQPNTAKLLELLGGHQLYGDAIWAYRELIQNAFDAVKEQIAWQIITKNLDPAVHLESLCGLYTIDLSLVKEEDGIWLICKDQGVGMTKGIIEQFFLQSGASGRHEIKQLERECRSRGFALERTGRFGIGVLSYFMLADKLIVRTQRELNTGYHFTESMGWQFEINGTHDFGELVRAGLTSGGTEVRLRLKQEVAAAIQSWDARFFSFLKGEIVRTPCMLRYRSYLNQQELAIAPGWTNDVADIRNKVERRANEVINSMDVVADIGRRTGFLMDEGFIDGIGYYRMHFPYFRLEGGNSFFYLNERDIEGQRRVLRMASGYYWQCGFEEVEYSMNGIRVEVTDQIAWGGSLLAYMELDIVEPEVGELNVSRRGLDLNDRISSLVVQRLDQEIEALIGANRGLFDNEYALLNCRIIWSFPKQFYWFFPAEPAAGNSDQVWKEIDFPALMDNVDLVPEWVPENPVFDGKPVSQLDRDIRDVEDHPQFDDLKEVFTWRYIASLEKRGSYDLHWLLKEAPVAVDQGDLETIELPEAWNKLLAVRKGEIGVESIAVNRRHPLYASFEAKEAWRFYDAQKQLQAERRFPDTTDEVACLCFLIYFVSHYSLYSLHFQYGGEWDVYEQAEGMKAVFARLEVEEVLLYVQGDFNELFVFTPEGVSLWYEPEEMAVYLPPIDDERWYLRPG